MDAWVLWHMYGDGSDVHIERVYLEQDRAQEDYTLLKNQPGGTTEWHLEKVRVFGQHTIDLRALIATPHQDGVHPGVPL